MNRVKSIVQATSALLIMMGIIHATMTIKSVAPNFQQKFCKAARMC